MKIKTLVIILLAVIIGLLAYNNLQLRVLTQVRQNSRNIDTIANVIRRANAPKSVPKPEMPKK